METIQESRGALALLYLHSPAYRCSIENMKVAAATLLLSPNIASYKGNEVAVELVVSGIKVSLDSTD